MRPAGATKELIIDLAGLLALGLGLGAVLLWAGRALSYDWQWWRVPRFIFTLEDGRLTLGPLVKGLGVTLQLTLLSFGLTIFLGLAMALGRLSGSLAVRALSRGVMEFIRNTPLIVQIFFFYYVLAPALGVERFMAAVLTLGVFEGAYASEIFRAGLASIPKGQWEAAASLGLGRGQALFYVIIPQAVRRVLPPLANQTVSLVKDSALASTIAVADLAMAGRAVISDTFLTFEIWFTVAGIYLALTITLSLAAARLERVFTYDA